MDIDWIHRPDSLNLCFNALDRHVVHGRADTVALSGDLSGEPTGVLPSGADAERPMTYARLLEEVAAFGGVLRAFETGPGDTVVARLAPGRAALVAFLASLRIGAVHVLEEPYDGTVTVVGPGDQVLATVRRSGESADDDLDWDVALRAGRTDPAPCAEVLVAAPALVVAGETVSTAQLLEHHQGWPYEALATLLEGGTLRL